MKTYDKLLLDSAPPGVIHTALERQENRAGYMVYYAVVKDPENPRKGYQWRCVETDYEAIASGRVASFWEAQPGEFTFEVGREDGAARLWAEKQNAKMEALEALLKYAGLMKEFYDRCFDFYGWDHDWGVFTLLPEEIKGRPKIALELLKERAVTQGGEIDAKA